MRTNILLTFIVFLFCSCLSIAQKIQYHDLDLVINKIMMEKKLPGLAIAIVKDDSIIFAKGYGVRKIGESAPIDEHTLFQAASITKSFTATLLGILVDRGKIKWDDPVKKYIPGFETSEPFVTKILTIQDLVSIRSGFLEGDTLHGTSRMDLIPQIKNLKISDLFRISQTSYNLNFTLAGLIAEIIEGKSWEAIIKNELFIPLKMKETYTDIPSALDATKNVSTPYYNDEGKILPTEWEETGIYGPADAIITNVMDLGNYVKMYLHNGLFENKSIVNSETLAEIQTPKIVTADFIRQFFNPKANSMTFGSGWAISDYKGNKIVQMAGMISGSTTLISLIPSVNTGIVIQTNIAGAVEAFVPINYKIFDDLLSTK